MNTADIKYARPGQTLNDDVVTGLSLRCLATKKSWSLYYRFRGQQRRPTLGNYPTLTLADAREVARGILKQVAQGIDPSAEKQDSRGAMTVWDLWDEHWKQAQRKKSAAEDKRLWEKHLRQHVIGVRVEAVDLALARHIHREGSYAPVQANRVLALLSTMLNHAEALGWRPVGSNPCRHVKRYKEQKRRRYMTSDEARVIAALLEKYKATHPQAVAFIYLLILTGARKGEIANAKWSNFHWADDGGARLVLHEHKTDGAGALRTIHLPVAVRQLLASLPQNEGTIVGIKDPKKLWEKIRAEAGCPDLRLHDLRHSFASAAVSAGLTLAQIGELLGHSSTQTTARYAHLMNDAAQQAANQTAGELSRMMGVTAPR